MEDGLQLWNRSTIATKLSMTALLFWTKEEGLIDQLHMPDNVNDGYFIVLLYSLQYSHVKIFPLNQGT